MECYINKIQLRQQLMTSRLWYVCGHCLFSIAKDTTEIQLEDGIDGCKRYLFELEYIDNCMQQPKASFWLGRFSLRARCLPPLECWLMLGHLKYSSSIPVSQNRGSTRSIFRGPFQRRSCHYIRLCYQPTHQWQYPNIHDCCTTSLIRNTTSKYDGPRFEVAQIRGAWSCILAGGISKGAMPTRPSESNDFIRPWNFRILDIFRGSISYPCAIL